MSWFTEMAGKAEAVLNQLDSETASAFCKIRGENNDKKTLPLHSNQDFSVPQPRTSNLNYMRSEPGAVNLSKENFRKGTDKFKKQDKERDLLATLVNSTSKKNLELPLEAMADNDTKSSVTHSRHSSQSSGSSFFPMSGRNTPGYTALDMESSGGSAMSESYVKVDEAGGTTSSSRSSSQSGLSYESDKKSMLSSQSEQKFSNSFGETSTEAYLLKKELSSLNQEMNQALKRAKEAEKETQSVKSQMSTISIQQRQTEAFIRESQERELSLQHSVKENELVIASLKRNIHEHNDTHEVLQEQNQRLLEGANESNSLHTEALSSLQEKRRQFDVLLDKEKELHAIRVTDLQKKLERLEEDQKSSTKDLLAARKTALTEKEKVSSLSAQINSLKLESSRSQEELADYKCKAGRILQTKDKLINSLRQGNDGAGGGDQFVQEELEQIRSERNLLQEELDHSSQLIKRLRSEAADCEVVAQEEMTLLHHQITQLQDSVNQEKQECHIAQEDLFQTKQDVRSMQEEISQHKLKLSTKLQERDMEIEKLQKQISHRISSASSVSELESRIHGLTESLIHKQTSIESLSSDKHTLQIQMERLQNQYEEAQRMLNTDTVTDLGRDDKGNRVPSFMAESPFDGGVTLGVKKAYSSMDKFSVRFGVFLRRYPAARVFMFMYMGLLHLWVMIVLFTYSPEIHPAGFHDSPKGSVPHLR